MLQHKIKNVVYIQVTNQICKFKTDVPIAIKTQDAFWITLKSGFTNYTLKHCTYFNSDVILIIIRIYDNL